VICYDYAGFLSLILKLFIDSLDGIFGLEFWVKYNVMVCPPNVLTLNRG
jgi:hypothetical protein